MQEAFERAWLDKRMGKILTDDGWKTFLNYYVWMQTAVDVQVGRVMDLLVASPFNYYTDVVFTADHGDFGGSHSLHSKTGGIYEEAIRVPFYVSFGKSQRMDYYGTGSYRVNRDFTCSSVDVLPFFYSLAHLGESWRYNPADPLNYLNGRESILDAIANLNALNRRTAVVGDIGYPYILHTMDEYRSAALCPPGQETCVQPTAIPTHAVAFRTPVGKLGTYSFWENNSILPVDSSQPGELRQPQYEWYDLVTNPGEMGNQALLAYDTATKVSTLNGTAAMYKAAFDSIKNSELYDAIYPQIAAVHAAALAAYLNS